MVTPLVEAPETMKTGVNLWIDLVRDPQQKLSIKEVIEPMEGVNFIRGAISLTDKSLACLRQNTPIKTRVDIEPSAANINLFPRELILLTSLGLLIDRSERVSAN